MKPSTNGEKLYIFLRDKILDSDSSSCPDWRHIGGFLAEVAGTDRFSGYIRGAVAIHAMRRIFRYWNDEKQQISDESQYLRKLRKIIGSEMFPWLDEELKGRLARQVVAAVDSSFQKIPPSVKRNVVGKSRRANCYLCSREIFEDRPESDPEFLTLEHVWPQSMGGDSVEGNLLPACRSCQEDTKDTLSWEWLNIHNLVLPSEPTESALKSVSRREKTARHFEHAIQVANELHITMKEALLRIGPREPELAYIRTGMPVNFFDLRTVRNFDE